MNTINSMISGIHFGLFFSFTPSFCYHEYLFASFHAPSRLLRYSGGVVESQCPACRSLVEKMNIVKIHDDLNNKSSTHNSLIKPVVATLGYNGIAPFYPPWVPLLPEKTHSSSLPRWKKDLSLWLNSGFQCGI